MIKSYFSCLLVMSSVKLPSLQDYFTARDPLQDPRSCDFIRKRMNITVFRRIQASINFSVDFVESMVSTIHLYYDHGKMVASDESMVPTKNGNNPHHMHVPNKPHPNGIMV